jgi:hypothetical protein
MVELIGFSSLIGFVFAIIVFCIFVGMLLRLGRIEILLREMALHQGAIQKEQEQKAPEPARITKEEIEEMHKNAQLIRDRLRGRE